MSFFDNAYIGTPPWDIGKAQPAFERIAEKNNFFNLKGPLLDIGCGTGENSLFFAQKLGFQVTGIDTSSRAIAKACEKANGRNLNDKANFLDYDLFKLRDYTKKFNTIIDCGVFHMFDKRSRIEYVKNVKEVLNEHGKLIILAFSYLEPLGVGPSQRLTKDDYQSAFKDGWKIIGFKHDQFEVRITKEAPKGLITIIEKEE